MENPLSVMDVRADAQTLPRFLPPVFRINWLYVWVPGNYCVIDLFTLGANWNDFMNTGWLIGLLTDKWARLTDWIKLTLSLNYYLTDCLAGLLTINWLINWLTCWLDNCFTGLVTLVTSCLLFGWLADWLTDWYTAFLGYW